jgi:hypothetical protein
MQTSRNVKSSFSLGFSLPCLPGTNLLFFRVRDFFFANNKEPPNVRCPFWRFFQ